MAEARRTKEGKIALGPIGEQLRRNVKQLREAQGLSTTALSKLLEERVGRPISPTGITKVEMGDRRVDVGDLVALALALKVTPNRLLLPTDEDVAEFPIMKGIKASEESLWAWAQGERALFIEISQVREVLDSPTDEGDSDEAKVGNVKALLLKEEDDFRRNSLPVKQRRAMRSRAFDEARIAALRRVHEARAALADAELQSREARTRYDLLREHLRSADRAHAVAQADVEQLARTEAGEKLRTARKLADAAAEDVNRLDELMNAAQDELTNAEARLMEARRLAKTNHALLTALDELSTPQGLAHYV